MLRHSTGSRACRGCAPSPTGDPRGKGRDRIVRGLAEHLLSAYPTPAFLWNAFFEDEAEALTRVVAHVATGGSLFKACESGLLPVALTRRMCHRVLQAPARSRFLKAIREVQVNFWNGVLTWFCRNPQVRPNTVGPLVDYIAQRHSSGHGATSPLTVRSSAVPRAWP